MSTETTMSTSMNGGDGEHSYFRNSTHQRNALELTKLLISEGIAEKLDVNEVISLSLPKIFRIADLGCSVGPNTFTAVQTIIKSVQLKCQSYYGSSEDEEANLEFQVFFNDHISNDFNMLFKNLASDRRYFAAAVPGRFQGRLFPMDSMHFIHSSYALHWLSNTPKELVDKNSPAYNKGRVYFTYSPKEVFEAYKAEFAKEITSFLDARAQELVPGGLMAILIPSIPDENPRFQAPVVVGNSLIDASLIDMAKEGLISEAKMDTFNLPIYNPTPREFKALIENNSCFSIEIVELIAHQIENQNIKSMISLVRAVWEGVISEHFGKDMMDQLFDRLAKKIESYASSNGKQSYNMVELFVLLRRNTS